MKIIINTIFDKDFLDFSKICLNYLTFVRIVINENDI